MHDCRDSNANTPLAANNMPAVPAMAATVDVTISSSFEAVFVSVWLSVTVDIGEKVGELIMYVEEGLVLELFGFVVEEAVLTINRTQINI